MASNKEKCKDFIFIMARASTEPATWECPWNQKCTPGLKVAYPGKVICQGVGNPSSTSLADNAFLGNNTPATIQMAQSLFKMAAEKCPKSVIVFGGYSKGTPVMHNAVKGLLDNIKSHLAVGVLFGDTRNVQDNGQVTAGHFAYMRNGDGNKTVAFLKEKINAAKRN